MISILCIILFTLPANAQSDGEISIQLTQLTDSETREYSPRWSPDGNKIAYLSGMAWSDIIIIDSDGSNPEKIINGLYLGRPSWSPDQLNILYSRCTGSNIDSIYIVDTDGKNEVKIATGYHHSSTDWSPDGNRILFQIQNTDYLDIGSMNIDGSDLIILANTFDFERFGTYSPDGTKIAYRVGHDNGQKDIYIMDVDGSNQQLLIPNADWPSFSPDSSKIAFQRYNEFSNNDIYIANSDGTGIIQLTTDLANDGNPDWSLTGNRIAFNSDRNGNMDIWVMDFTQPPVADANGPYVSNEGSLITLDASGSSDPDGSIVNYEWDFDNDGQYDDATGVNPNIVFDDDGSFIVGLKVTDDDGGVGTDTLVVTVNNVAPTIISLTGPIDPVEVNTAVSITGTFTDPGILDTHTATFDWGDGATCDGTVTESGGSGTVTGTHEYIEAGVYTITLTVTDDDGGIDSETFQYVVVYDPEGGFVTGGGWIHSPAGASVQYLDAEGKATFGFVSKYKKGATVPTGNTQFNFNAGNINFHSDNYDWLVIANHKAMYKGTGTINGAGNYGFILSAIDEKLTPSTDVDIFRIKIWDKDDNDAVVYDNQIGADDDEDPTTAIQGGNIVIHK